MSYGSEDKTTWGSGGLFGNRALGSLVLMVLCPFFCLTFVFMCHDLEGSLFKLWDFIVEHQSNPVKILTDIMPSPVDPVALRLIGYYAAFELLLMRIVPGKQFKATVTATGHTPVYKANGFQCYIITVLTVLCLYYAKILDATLIYDKMGNIISSLNAFALLLCAFLVVKGLNFPSTMDAGTNGNLIVDFFWGTELYPRVFGWDIKQFTNCRFGMMYWQVGIICYALAQYERHGYIASSMLVSLLVQSVYVAKFFLWETGYFCTMDIQHDRAGYYLCWGCLVWVPSMYTIHTYYLVNHPVALSVPVTLLYLIAGVYSVWVNYDCDRQRQEFRATSGKAKVWGREPVYIEAKYLTGDGQERSSLLLASGWWGISRHFHYVPEIMAAFFWCVPGGIFDSVVPYFYPIYLTILLVDRAWRDDKRCGDKYAEYWEAYCKIVPYKVIPGVV